MSAPVADWTPGWSVEIGPIGRSSVLLACPAALDHLLTEDSARVALQALAAGVLLEGSARGAWPFPKGWEGAPRPGAEILRWMERPDGGLRVEIGRYDPLVMLATGDRAAICELLKLAFNELDPRSGGRARPVRGWGGGRYEPAYVVSGAGES